MRKVKREVTIGNLTIGGHNPVAVQTMLNVRADDVAGNVAQAVRVAEAGCQIVRVSVPTLEDVRLIEAIKNAVDIPLVADIHFNHRIALACVDAGVDKIRLNPGNIGGDDHVKEVAAACKAKNIPIRIGVNAGSLEKEVLAKYGAPVPEALVESAMYHVSLLEKYDFDNIVISIKSSNVPRMMEAYRLLSERCDYPLHVGVTEAGTYRMGLIKSGMGIGGLLMEGIGDTLRVSLTDEPEKEVQAGFDILRAGDHQLPHLRAHQHPGGQNRGRGGTAPQGIQKAHQGGRDGLRCQRPRRGPGGGHRHRRRQGRGAAVHPRREDPDAAGRHRWPAGGRNLQAVRAALSACGRGFCPARGLRFVTRKGRKTIEAIGEPAVAAVQCRRDLCPLFCGGARGAGGTAAHQPKTENQPAQRGASADRAVRASLRVTCAPV